MKKTIRMFLKAVAFLLSFSMLFIFFQEFLTPKYRDKSTISCEGFYQLPENSIDVLFLGSSQMFCTVMAQKLYEDYHINAYDFGAADQRILSTEYYFIEALKTQTPKIIMLEVCRIFMDCTDIGDTTLSWSYAPMKLSNEKVQSLYQITGGDCSKTFCNAIPLFQYHSRWNDIEADDFSYYFDDKEYYLRGFSPRYGNYAKNYQYLLNDDGTIRKIPYENIEAISRIKQKCDERGIKLILFKTPAPDWSRNDSKIVKEFMNDNHLEYLEMNDYYEEIGLSVSDYYDEDHLNVEGAKKTTSFLSHYLTTIAKG